MMTLRSMIASRSRLYWILSFLIGAVLAFWYLRTTSVRRGPILIGFANSAPYHYPKPDGAPAGIAYEVMSEAARRAGIEVQWVFCPEDSEQALRSGKVELWPMVADFPDRRKYFYISDPWIGSDFFVLARKDADPVSERFSGSIGEVAGGVRTRLIRNAFPRATVTQLNSTRQLVAAVCGGQVAAGLFESGETKVALESRLPECGATEIRAYPMPGLRLNFGIGASFRARRLADRLLDQVYVLAREGFLLSTTAKYSVFGLGEITATHSLIQLRERQRTLYWSIAGLSLGLSFTLLLCWSLYRARRALAKADTEKTESVIRYSLASRASNDVIWDWNPKTGQVIWSELMKPLFGYSTQEIGRDMSWRDERVHPEDRGKVVESIGRALARGSGTWSEEYRFRRSDGSYASVMDRGCIVYDDAHKPLRMVGTMSDMTRQRLLEEQLRQSQRLEAIGRLAGGVAHDFNNLLTIIKGYSEFLIEKTEPQSEAREYAEEIAKAGQSAAALTQQLLAFSRRQIIEPKVVDLNAVLSGSERMIRRLLGEDIEMVTNPGQQPCCVFADMGQLHQVIMNLAVNARDAMPAGGRLTIEISRQELDAEYVASHKAGIGPGSFVLLAISDTGSGMDEETLSHIFEPFYTTKKTGAGTGLGLSTVYGIVKQSGGWVWVYSEPGKGTTFKTYWPLVDAPAARPDAPQTCRADRAGTETILIVEDKADVRRLAARILTLHGYRVVEASTGEEALSFNGNRLGTVDLLFTDVVLPGMSGRRLAERVAQLRPGIKILYASGYTEDVIARSGILLPGIAFLPKPYSQEELLKKIREVFDS